MASLLWLGSEAKTGEKCLSSAVLRDRGTCCHLRCRTRGRMCLGIVTHSSGMGAFTRQVGANSRFILSLSVVSSCRLYTADLPINPGRGITASNHHH